MCLIIVFRHRPYNERLHQPSEGSLSRWLRRKFTRLFDDYDMLFDKPSQPSPLDVAPTNVPTRDSGEATSTVAPETNESASSYTSERSFHKSN